MIPPVNGKLTRTLDFPAPSGDSLLFTLTPDNGGTVEFRTTGRRPTRWTITLLDVFSGLLAKTQPAAAPDDAAGPPGGVAKKLLGGSKVGTLISLQDLEHELSIAHPDDVPRHAEFLRYVYSVMRTREARATAAAKS